MRQFANRSLGLILTLSLISILLRVAFNQREPHSTRLRFQQ